MVVLKFVSVRRERLPSEIVSQESARQKMFVLSDLHGEITQCGFSSENIPNTDLGRDRNDAGTRLVHTDS